jgi:predicted NodU family carbamoyl transferase
MKILGVNISHDFSICIYENKEVKDLWYEERFNLLKHWDPHSKKENNNFILSILKKINFKPDLVCYSSLHRLEENDTRKDYDIINYIQKQLDNPNYFYNKHYHHIYHALCSFYFSKFEETMSIVIDGGGARPFDNNYQEMQSVFYLNKKLIYLLHCHLSNRKFIQIPTTIEDYSNIFFITFKNNAEYYYSSKSIGGFDFNRVCNLIGFEDGNNAGKLMGLSSYAYSKDKYNLNYEHVEMAKKTQEKSFNDTCQLIEKAYEYKKIKNFVLSGGYFLNCSNNFKYIKKYPEFNFFVDPIPTDGGTAIGACMYYDTYK